MLQGSVGVLLETLIFMGHVLGCPPCASNSHHQDDYIVLVGDPYKIYKPSFATGILGGGDNPSYNPTMCC